METLVVRNTVAYPFFVISFKIIISIQIVEMETYFFMMAIHYLLITLMELYLCVSTMCMVLCVMTSGIIWMPLLCVLNLVFKQLVNRVSFLSLSSKRVHCHFKKKLISVGSMAVHHSGLGSPFNRSIIMDNVVCSGGERNLTECDYSIINNCDRSEEAGVRCEGTVIYNKTLCII